MDMTPSEQVPVSYATDDPFLQELYARIPKDIIPTFTESQLTALRIAYGARSRGAHVVDLRPTIKFFRRRFYFVFLMGAERRAPTRKSFDTLHPVWTFANAVFLAVSLMVLLFALMGLLYTAKVSAGIDVFPGVDVLPDREIQELLLYLFE